MACTANFEYALANEVDVLTGREVARRTKTDIIDSMPCMYPPPNHLPLTPPDYRTYSNCGIQINQHQFAGSQGFPEKGVYEINIDPHGRKLMPSFVRVAPGYAPHPAQQAAYTGFPPPGITHPGNGYYQQQQHQRPQMTVDENFAHHRVSHSETRRHDAPAAALPAEEKPTGGVSAHLDYEMEEMTDFVGTMAQNLVLGKPSQEKLLPSYRKFVFQILSSTRLPSSTILLGLVYLRERVSRFQSSGPTVMRQDNVYRLLTIALLLASKFLDDNTFQNKSWAEVTNLPVAELNSLEKEWLRSINWNLHFDPEGTKGFSQYKSLWENWVRKSQPVPTLAPIDTNVRPRSHSTFSAVPLYPPHGQLYTPPHSGVLGDRAMHLPPVRSARQTPEACYQWGWGGDYSPPSAPVTGPTTPEGHFGWSNVQGYAAPVQQAQQQPAHISRLPPIMSTCPGYPQKPWYYQAPSEPFFSAPNYGPPITA